MSDVWEIVFLLAFPAMPRRRQFTSPLIYRSWNLKNYLTQCGQLRSNLWLRLKKKKKKGCGILKMVLPMPKSNSWEIMSEVRELCVLLLRWTNREADSEFTGSVVRHTHTTLLTISMVGCRSDVDMLTVLCHSVCEENSFMNVFFFFT